MKIRVLTNVHSEGRALDEGQVLHVPDFEGEMLVAIGRAIPVPADTPETGQELDIETAQAAPVVERASIKGGKRR